MATSRFPGTRQRPIARSAPTETVWITDAELDARPELVKTMSVQPPRGAGRVRLLRIPDIDLQPCGGTHVRNIGEIGAIRVLKQYERGVVFFLGKFEGVREAGVTLIFVPLQQMVRVSLRTVTMQIPSQKIITKDNVSIDIAAVAYYHVTDPEKSVIAIENV